MILFSLPPPPTQRAQAKQGRFYMHGPVILVQYLVSVFKLSIKPKTTFCILAVWRYVTVRLCCSFFLTIISFNFLCVSLSLYPMLGFSLSLVSCSLSYVRDRVQVVWKKHSLYCKLKHMSLLTKDAFSTDIPQCLSRFTAAKWGTLLLFSLLDLLWNPVIAVSIKWQASWQAHCLVQLFSQYFRHFFL